MDLSRNVTAVPTPPRIPHVHAVEEAEVDLGKVFATLWLGKWVIGIFALCAILIGGAYAYLIAVPLYRATAVVILETNQEKIVDLQTVASGLTGDRSEVNSELEVLRARGLIGKVVNRLNLVADPEFNRNLTAPSLKARIRGTVADALGQPASLPRDNSNAKRTQDAVISSLLSRVSVSNVHGSVVFRVSVQSVDPAKAALIADTITELYILDQIEVKFAATEQATVWLSDRVAELQADLEDAEADVSEFSAATELVSVEGLRALERQIKELRDRIDAADQTREVLASKLASVDSPGSRETRAAVLNDPQLMRLLQRADTDVTVGKAFDLRAVALVQGMSQDLMRTDQQLKALAASKSELEALVARQGDDLITLQQLTREAEATRALYEYFLTRLKETSAQQGIQQADSRILSQAVIPERPYFPRKSRIVVMAAVLGLVLGAGVVVLRELRCTSFRTARELEQATGHTVLGQIPLMPTLARRKVLQYLSDKPTSAAAEAVRNLRTSLMLSNVDRPPQVIVSTSSVPGEGKTTNALALAHNLLGLGKSVLLVEGDIRRRTFRHYFEDMPDTGIVSVLSGEMSLEQAVYRSPTFGADILGGEPSRINAADLFVSEKFKTMIMQARQAYDVIIIDTPPVLIGPDARIIAEQGDAMILSVRWDKTSKPQLDEAVRLFRNSGLRVTGMILSQVSARGMKRYGHGAPAGVCAGDGAPYYAN